VGAAVNSEVEGKLGLKVESVIGPIVGGGLGLNVESKEGIGLGTIVEPVTEQARPWQRAVLAAVLDAIH
jgi:hypothetical protein